MSDERKTLFEILVVWKGENGEIHHKLDGEEYIRIKGSLSNLRDLAQTMVDNGYTYAEMSSPSVGSKIGEWCWRDDYIVKMSGAEVKKEQKKVATAWLEVVVQMFSEITISKANPIDNPVHVKPGPKKEEVKVPKLDVIPKDRIAMDTSDLADPELDLDFLNEIGVDETFVRGDNNE